MKRNDKSEKIITNYWIKMALVWVIWIAVVAWIVWTLGRMILRSSVELSPAEVPTLQQINVSKIEIIRNNLLRH